MDRDFLFRLITLKIAFSDYILVNYTFNEYLRCQIFFSTSVVYVGNIFVNL